MMFTPKRVPSTSLTVSETPSSATEPFAAMKGASSRGLSSTNLDAVAVGLAREDLGPPVDMAGHEMAAELIAEAQARVRD